MSCGCHLEKYYNTLIHSTNSSSSSSTSSSSTSSSSTSSSTSSSSTSSSTSSSSSSTSSSTSSSSTSSNNRKKKEKKLSLTLPWVVLFSDSGLYQSPGSLRTRRRTCAVPRRVLFCCSTSLIVPGIWASQPGNLSAIAPSAPTTTGITMILTFHSCSSSIFND